MILLDPRIGSGELLPYFRPYDIPVELTPLDSGDACFFGNGPDGDGLMGFERKVITDLATSKRDNRLQGFQLPKMSETYAICHLIVEGIWRPGEGGLIEVWCGKGWRAMKPTMMYRELDHFLAELSYIKGIFIERTSDRAQTVAYLVSRYKFFNDKHWSQHDRTDKIYAPCNPTQGANGRSIRSGFIKRTVPTLERQMIQVDGIGNDAYWIGRRFGNMETFMKHSIAEIAETVVERNAKEGRKEGKLGLAKARKAYDAEREN